VFHVTVISPTAVADALVVTINVETVTFVVALIVPTVAVIVAVPLPMGVKVAVAIPPVVVPLAGMVPNVGPTVIANATAVPSGTGLPLPSVAVTVMVDGKPVCTELGEAVAVTVIAGSISIEIVPVAVPTVAVIVSTPTAEAVNVAVAMPLKLVVRKGILPRETSLNEKLTGIPAPRGLPA